MANGFNNRLWQSLGILLASVGLAYAPLPGVSRTLVVVSGSELSESLEILAEQFEQSHPNIDIEIEIQGSQDIVNHYLDDRNRFTPTVLIPANGEVLEELRDRWFEADDPFYDQPQPIAKTLLVGIAWPERGNVLFPTGEFDWERLQLAMESRRWGDLGGPPEWGSFDFVTTDPTRSNSGQLTLSLFVQDVELRGSAPNSANLSQPDVQELFELVRSSVYQPPRSTDILLQEFITRGPNDADVATVYESIALHRWSEAAASHSNSYQIYYLNPTIETISTAAIARRDVSPGTANAARKFIDFLSAPEQQQVFVRFGFRPAVSSINLEAVPGSPWAQGIPGADPNPSASAAPPPSSQVTGEIQRLWERAN